VRCTAISPRIRPDPYRAIFGSVGRGKRVVCMDGFDLYEMLQRSLPFDHVIDGKVRRAAETGLPFTRVRDLLSIDDATSFLRATFSERMPCAGLRLSRANND